MHEFDNKNNVSKVFWQFELITSAIHFYIGFECVFSENLADAWGFSPKTKIWLESLAKCLTKKSVLSTFYHETIFVRISFHFSSNHRFYNWMNAVIMKKLLTKLWRILTRTSCPHRMLNVNFPQAGQQSLYQEPS